MDPSQTSDLEENDDDEESGRGGVTGHFGAGDRNVGGRGAGRGGSSDNWRNSSMRIPSAPVRTTRREFRLRSTTSCGRRAPSVVLPLAKGLLLAQSDGE